jgi:hypothetical protein
MGSQLKAEGNDNSEPIGPIRRARRFIKVLPPDASIETEDESGDDDTYEESSSVDVEASGPVEAELTKSGPGRRKDQFPPGLRSPELDAEEDELNNGGRGEADENAVEENVPFCEPERFSRVFVAIADIVNREFRDAAWDAHMQWMRRGCLDPDAGYEVSWALTGLDATCLEPRYQVLLLRANASGPVSTALGVNSHVDRSSRTALGASEPLVAVGGVGPWALFEAQVDDEMNVSMPVRAPHVFLGLFNTSCRDYNDSPPPNVKDVKAPEIITFPSADGAARFGDGFVPGLTPRALAAEAARRAAESPLRRRLRLQREFHHTMSPHLSPPDAGSDGDPRDPYDLSSPLTEDAEGDASPGGGYFEERASRAAQAEAVGGVVSLFATLYPLSDETTTSTHNATETGLAAGHAGQQPSLDDTDDRFRSRLPIGTFLILNAASSVEARKYVGYDPLSGDMYSQVRCVVKSNL